MSIKALICVAILVCFFTWIYVRWHNENVKEQACTGQVVRDRGDHVVCIKPNK